MIGALHGAVTAYTAMLAAMTPEQRRKYFLDQKQEVRLAKELADREGLRGAYRERLINYAREVAA